MWILILTNLTRAHKILKFILKITMLDPSHKIKFWHCDFHDFAMYQDIKLWCMLLLSLWTSKHICYCLYFILKKLNNYVLLSLVLIICWLELKFKIYEFKIWVLSWNCLAARGLNWVLFIFLFGKTNYYVFSLKNIRHRME